MTQLAVRLLSPLAVAAASKRSARSRSAAIKAASEAGRPYSDASRNRRTPGSSGSARRRSSIQLQGREVGFGEVPIILGEFLTPLGEGPLLRLRPAPGFLHHRPA